MGSSVSRLLLSVALVASLLGTARAGTLVNSCCVCECPGFATQCTDVGSPTACGPILGNCGNATNTTCITGIGNGTCAAQPECAAAPAGAPSLDVTGLTIAVVVLGGLAALRLRRRPARQRR